MNPSGSIKDRIVKYMLEKAISQGELKKGDTIVEASSGNTGSAVALLSAFMGFKSIICTNEKCSKEKMNTITGLGAELRLSEPGESYEKMAEDIRQSMPNA